MTAQKKRLFVAMPFGKREGNLEHNGNEETVTIDFDDVWRNMFRPAIPQAFEYKRADELSDSHIEKEYVEWLRTSDVVLADLTFGNANVYYELGVRLTIRKYGTVLVAHKGSVLPFDTRQFRIIFYETNMATKYEVFKKRLKTALSSAHELESPIYVYQPGLFVSYYEDGKFPNEIISDLQNQISKLKNEKERLEGRYEGEHLLVRIKENFDKEQVLMRIYGMVQGKQTVSEVVLEELGRNLTKVGRIEESWQVLERARSIAPNNSEVLRELGFVYRKKGKDFYPDAEKHLGKALEINPIDTEAHGMLGGLLKRKGDLINAQRHYLLAYKIAPKSLYAIIAVAGLSVLLGNEDDARKYYMEVIQVANQEIERGKDNYWTYLSLGEASVAMGNVIESKGFFQRALEYEPPIEDVRSSYDQLVALSKEGFRTNEIQEIINGDLARYLGRSKPKA